MSFEILIFLFVIFYPFKNSKVEFLLQAGFLAAIILMEAIWGMVQMIQHLKKSWQTMCMALLYILQVIVFTSDILTKNYQPWFLCILTVWGIILKDKFLKDQLRAEQ